MAEDPLKVWRSDPPDEGAPSVDEMPPSFAPRHVRSRPSEGESFSSWIRETALVVVIALALSFLVKTFLIQAFYIPSESMEDTLAVSDRILVNKTVRDSDIDHGDVVVFKDPGDWLPPPPEQASIAKRIARDTLIAIGILPVDAGEHLIKRVIGLPGDRVACCGESGKLTVNGVEITEPYVKPGVEPSMQEFDVVVPPDHVWLMGDNRSNSRDSRAHMGSPGGGFVPIDDVIGRAFVIMWPYDRWAYLGGGNRAFSDVPAP